MDTVADSRILRGNLFHCLGMTIEYISLVFYTASTGHFYLNLSHNVIPSKFYFKIWK